ncbi:hypothetical protein I3843_14G099600 [Carya illinoinensis]|nr:hypothetical protein I3843_14G099600 [Carya illinoinensis]
MRCGCNKYCRSVLHSSLRLRSALPHNRAAAKQGIPIWFCRDLALSPQTPSLDFSHSTPIIIRICTCKDENLILSSGFTE